MEHLAMLPQQAVSNLCHSEPAANMIAEHTTGKSYCKKGKKKDSSLISETNISANKGLRWSIHYAPFFSFFMPLKRATRFFSFFDLLLL